MYIKPSLSRCVLYSSPIVHDDWGTILSTKRKMAFSGGTSILFRIIHIN